MTTLFSVQRVSGQMPDGWDWSNKVASNKEEFASSIATDPTHNAVYTAGQVERGFSSILGGSWTSLYGSNTGSDGYLVKQDLSGNVQWQVVLGAAGSDAITGVCTDVLGNVYVTGYFSGSNASFTGATGSSQTMSSSGGEDIFVAGYNGSGALLWKINTGGSGNDRASSICYANGQLFVGGFYVGSPTIGGFSTPTVSVGSASTTHGLILGMDAATGSISWLSTGSNSNNSAINAVATDGTKVYALGVHKGSPYTFRTSTNALTIGLSTISSSLSADIMALSAGGVLSWAQAVSNPGSDQINALGVAASASALYISGSSHNNSVFPGNTVLNVSVDPHDYGYVARLSKVTGETIWTRPFYGSHNHAQVGRALATDDQGNLLLAGTFEEDFYSPPSLAFSGEDDLEVFLAKISAQGKLKWIISPSGQGDDMPNGVAQDGSGGVYIAGSYSEDITFNTDFTDHDSQNLFTAKLGDLDYTVGTFHDPSAFNSFGPVCVNNGAIDLGTLLLPARSGTGKSVYSSAGIATNGGNGPSGALGQIPGGLAIFDDAGDQIIIDLGDTIPIGEKVIIRWKSAAGNAVMNVQGGLTGGGPFTDLGSITTSLTGLIFSNAVATVPVRFVKLKRTGTATFHVDGVFYNFGSAPDGTWSGPGVTGSSFSPVGLSGNVDITYTFGGLSTTHTITVATIPVGGTLTGGNVCPGSPFTATLTGQSAGAIYWSTSTNNGGSWQTQGPLGATFTIPSVTQTTLLKVQVKDPPCPAATSNVATITISDNIPPVITCPVDVVVNTNSGCTATGVNLGSAAANDDCSSVTVTNNAPSFFPKGTTTVIWTATDASGNTATCTQTVTVTDNIPPVISCPTNVVANTNSGCTATGVSLGTPVTSDNCTGVTVTNNAPSSFPTGTTTVTWTATDASGNTATCAQAVTVTDNIPPAITCPANITVNAAVGTCGQAVTYTAPVGSDNCSGLTTSRIAGLASGSTFPVGANTVTYTATDAAGNTAACSFTITVVDNIPPAITCPANITVNAAAGTCGKIVTYTGPIGTDNCSGVTTARTAGLASGSTFPVGVNTVNYTATDAAGNTASCSFTITVIDNIPPAIACPANINVNAAAGTCGQAVTYMTPVGTDNCSGVTTTRTAGLASGSTFPVGVNTVTYTATDAAGNTASCSFTITVVDNIPPAITCPANITVNAAAGTCGKIVTYTGPIGTDNCSGVTTARTAGLASGSTFPVGVNTMSYTATDAAGNTASCSFTITVVDNIPPGIACPANITVNAAAGSCGKVVTYTAPVGSDNCSGVTTSRTAGLASGSTFPVGVNTITYTATDAAGNTAFCSFTITVVDNIPPSISCPANITVNAAAGTCGQTVTYTIPVGTDNCSGVSTARTAGLASGSTFPVGVNMVTYMATDAAGNNASCSFTITVIDNIPPSISCQANITVNAAAVTCAQSVTYAVPVGTDNCSGVATLRTAGLASGSVFPVGVSTVTYTTTDAAGNTASCSFTITVVDNIPPTIACPANITVNAAAASCTQVVTYMPPVGTDNCSGVATARTAGLASGATFTAGVNAVTYTATDAAGNTASCSFTITVVDNNPPTIICPIGVTATTNSGCTATGVVLGAPVTADNCGVATVTNNAPIVFPTGVTGVLWTVTDNSGNSTTCVQTVTVLDNIPPTIICPSNVVATANSGCTATGVNLGTPTSSDNCTGVTLTNNAPSAFLTGNMNVSWTASDAGGNTATCTQIVTVNDVTAPDIIATADIQVAANTGCSATGVFLATPYYSDNCSVTTITENAPDTFPLGNTTVTWTATDVSGNQSTSSQTVTVSDQTAPVAICQEVSVNLDASGWAHLTGNMVDNGSWDNCTLASMNVTPQDINTLGDHAVTLTVIDAAGNSTSCNTIVHVIDNLPPTATCIGSTLYLDPSGEASITAADLDGGSTDNEGISAWSASQLVFGCADVGLNTDTLFVSDGSGNMAFCLSTITVVDPYPVNAGADGTADLCNVGASTSLLPYLGSDAQAGGDWWFQGQPAPGLIDPAQDGSGTYLYTVANTSGCLVDSAVVTVVIHAIGVPGQDTSITVCSSTSAFSLMDLLPGADQGGAWSNGTGWFDPATAVTGTILYTLSDASVCPPTTAAVSIHVNIAPDAGTDASLALCAGAPPANLYDALLGSPDPGGNWTGPLGETVYGFYDPATLSEGPYTYTLSGVAPCEMSSATVVVSLIPLPSASWNSPDPVCSSNAPFSMSTFVTGVTGGSWSGPGINATGHEFAPQSVQVSGSSSAFTLTYTVTSNGCTSSSNGQITVIQNPVADAGQDTLVCGTELTLYANAPMGTGSWSSNTGATFNDQNQPDANVEVASTGIYHFQWTVINGICSAVDEVEVSFHSPEELTAVNAGADQLQDISTRADLQGSATGATATWWTVILGGAAVVSPTELNTLLNDLSIGENVIVLGARVGSCPAQTDTVVITVRGLLIPTGFSPDGDGVNDRYVVRGLEEMGNATLDVFDRWGNRVYHAGSYSNNWDGHGDRGELLPNGTYFGVLKIGGEDTWNGAITLKR
ncbi:MAG: HYR domain-containing protein [Flavobacteriales bacterium]